ncbi:MAG: hypothetical protein JXJ17_06090 [Anaerolineae bacterium]|nr:hypothetical protein [Anaerolineae bacterium]
MDEKQTDYKSIMGLARLILILLAILAAAMLVLIVRGVLLDSTIQQAILDVYINLDIRQAAALDSRIDGMIARAYGTLDFFLPVTLLIVLATVVLRAIWLRRTCRNLAAAGRVIKKSLLLIPITTLAVWKALEAESFASEDEEPTCWPRLIWVGAVLSVLMVLAFAWCGYLVSFNRMNGLIDVYQIGLGVVSIGWAYTIFRVVGHISRVQERIAGRGNRG